MEKQGYAYVDVRSVPEFEAGHPDGAFNIPILHLTGWGMTPNPDFAAVMERAFPKDAKIVVGCKAGGRSRQAAAILERLGFSSVVEQRAGFDGAADEPGWRQAGLPTAAEPRPGRTWIALRDNGR